MWILKYFILSATVVTVLNGATFNHNLHDKRYTKRNQFTYSLIDDGTILNDWVPTIGDEPGQQRFTNGFLSFNGQNDPYAKQPGFHFINVVNHQQPIGDPVAHKYKYSNSPPGTLNQQQQQQPRPRPQPSDFFHDKNQFRNTKNIHSEPIQDSLRSPSLKPLSIQQYPIKKPNFQYGPLGFNVNTNGNRLRNSFTRNKSNAPMKPFRASQPYPIEVDFNFPPSEAFRNTFTSSSYQNIVHSNFIDPPTSTLIDQSANEVNKFYTHLNAPSQLNGAASNVNKTKLSDILSPPPIAAASDHTSFYSNANAELVKKRPTTLAPPVVLYVTRPESKSKPKDFLTLSTNLKSSFSVFDGDSIPMPILPLVDYSKSYSQNRDYTRNATNPFKIDLNEYIKSRPNLRHLRDDESYDQDANGDADDDFFQNKTFVQFDKQALNATSGVAATQSANVGLSIEKIFPEIVMNDSTTDDPFVPMYPLNETMMDSMDDDEDVLRFTNLDESTETMNINLLRMNFTVDTMMMMMTTTTSTATPQTHPPKVATITATIQRRPGFRRKNGGDGEVCERACIRNIINQDYKPICASNKRTYSNKGSFRCASICGQDKKLQIKHTGICTDATR